MLTPTDGGPIEIARLGACVFEMAPGRHVALTQPIRVAAPIDGRVWAGVMASAVDDGRDVTISWVDAVSFCIRASELASLTSPYRFADYRPRMDYGLPDLERMLGQVMPPRRALSVLATFGADALSIMQFSPDRLTEVPGIGETLTAHYAKAWNRELYFAREVVWDRSADGFRLPTEAEWVYLTDSLDEPEEDWEWVWDGARGPTYAIAPTPLVPGEFVDPSMDWGPRRIVRGLGRRCYPPDSVARRANFRVVSTG